MEYYLMADQKTTKLWTPEFRVHFPYIWEPRQKRQADGSMKETFEIAMSFPKTADLSEMKAKADAIGMEKWGSKYEEIKAEEGFLSPFKDGNKKKKVADFKGRIIVNAKTNYRPGVVEMINNKPEPIIDPLEFYAGVYAAATVHFYAYDKEGNTGISCGLENLCKTREGKRLGGATSAADDFAGYQSEEEEVDPMS